MKNLMKMVFAALPLMTVGPASAQTGGMMNGGYGGMWSGGWMGGYGGYWVPILVVAVVAFLVWLVMQKRK